MPKDHRAQPSPAHPFPEAPKPGDLLVSERAGRLRLVRDGAGVDAIDCTILQGIGPATEVRFTAEGGLVCLRW